MGNELDVKSCFVCKHVPIWRNYYCGLTGQCKKSNIKVLYEIKNSKFYVDQNNTILLIGMCIHWEENKRNVL